MVAELAPTRLTSYACCVLALSMNVHLDWCSWCCRSMQKILCGYQMWKCRASNTKRLVHPIHYETSAASLDMVAQPESATNVLCLPCVGTINVNLGWCSLQWRSIWAQICRRARLPMVSALERKYWKKHLYLRSTIVFAGLQSSLPGLNVRRVCVVQDKRHFSLCSRLPLRRWYI